MELLRQLAEAVAYAVAVLVVSITSLVGMVWQWVAPPQTFEAPAERVAQTQPQGELPSVPDIQTPAESTEPEPTLPAAQESTPIPPPPKAAEPARDPEQILAEAHAALVNILCTVQTSSGLTPISGSGIMVDSRGVILTGAHVGQYFLLRDYSFLNNIRCTVRTGSPALARYTAELLYLPPSWIAANAEQIVKTQATGTGENDYAFLRVTGTILTGQANSSGTLPSSFPTLPLTLGTPSIGDSMLLVGYPAGFLGGDLITKSLYASAAYAYVTQLFNFTEGLPVGLFSIGGTVLSQAGSSGGAAVRADTGALAGIIVTATTGQTTGERDLRAITLSHIERSLEAHGEGGIVELLQGDTAAKAALFNAAIAPTLTQQLLNVLEN